MDLYTLTDTFLAKDDIDQYVSAIWTERYTKSGDCQIVLPATKENTDKLIEGTMLALRGSKEVMLLETQSIDRGLLTVTGNTLTEFLNQRIAWFINPESSDADVRIVDLTKDTLKPGEFISYVVDKSVITPTDFTGSYADANLTWSDEVIAGLVLGATDTSGVAKRLTATVGPLYDSIQQVAEAEKIGIKLYLESADPTAGFVLHFDTYSGLDRTSDQTDRPLVRLSQDHDQISNLKEIRSVRESKNVAYVYYQGVVTIHMFDLFFTPVNFCRRALLTNAEGEPVGRKISTRNIGGYYTQTVVGPAEIAAFREQNAKDALANHNYIRTIDGETSPHNEYTYGVDYGLGDIIELEGLTGSIGRARVTEYIRSRDQNGEKAYPTISVI